MIKSHSFKLQLCYAIIVRHHDIFQVGLSIMKLNRFVQMFLSIELCQNNNFLKRINALCFYRYREHIT